MDRLDAWLNAQHGWRFFALLCLDGWPFALMTGSGVIAAVGSAGLSPGPRSVVLAVDLSIPGAVPAGGLMLLLWLWDVRYARKRGKPGRPLLGWRFFLWMLFLAGSQVIGVLQNIESYRWNNAYPELFPIGMVLLAASMIAMLWDYIYQRRITRASDPAPGAGTSPYTWPG